MTPLEAAHEYQRMGYGVVPLYGVKDGACACPTGAACPSAGKHPHGRGGRWNVLTGGANVQAWYDDNPGDNLGIVTGPDSGIFVLDVDPEHSGYESIVQLVKEYGDLPATRIVKTGSGGVHYYYRHPSNFVVWNSTSYLAEGIDIRGKGGQVVAPPSVSGKGDYRVISDLDVVDAPAWLLTLLAEHSALKERGNNAEIRVAEHVDVELLPERVATLARQHVGMDEGRYKHFYSLVAACYEAGFTQGQAVTIAAPWCAAVGKFVGRVEQEVARSWGKLEAESQRANEWIDGLGDRPTGEREWDTSTSPATTSALAATTLGPTPASPPDSGSASTAGTAGTPGDELPDLPASWAPVDPGPILDGTYVPPAAELFPRADGHHLLYRGLVHSFHGESESGKSLIAQGEVARVLEDGGHAAYVDFESDAPSVFGRLRAMGAPDDALRHRFTYRRPDVDPFGMPNEREAFAGLLAQTLDLVVIDGVTDALSVFGAGSNDMDEVTNVMRRFPRRVAQRTGAAVVLIDHVAKDADTRGRHAVGSQAKLNGLDGAAYVIEVAEVLGQGLRGAVTMRVGKDRPGGVRPISGEWRKTDRTQLAARVVIDSTSGDGIHITVEAPDGPQGAVLEDGRELRPGWLTLTMERVSQALEAAGESLSMRQVRISTKGKNSAKDAALQTLIDDGFAGIERDGKYDRFTCLRPYRSAEDELSEDYLGWADQGGVPQRAPGVPQTEGAHVPPTPLPLRGGGTGDDAGHGVSVPPDEGHAATVIYGACKTCFAPTPEIVLNTWSGMCGKCKNKAGLT